MATESDDYATVYDAATGQTYLRPLTDDEIKYREELKQMFKEKYGLEDGPA